MVNGEAVLKPITDFVPTDLGLRLCEIVGDSNNRALLMVRHLLGPQIRYGDSQTAQASVTRAQDIHNMGVHEIYVVVGDSGDAEGLATIYPGLDLKKMRLPLPLGTFDNNFVSNIAKKIKYLKAVSEVKWWVDMVYANPNITAWTATDQEALLAQAYKELDYRVDPTMQNLLIRPWTIEPKHAPSYVHECIRATSLEYIRNGWFGDEESRRHMPPRSTLYARLHSKGWFTSRGAMHELRTGRSSKLDNFTRPGNSDKNYTTTSNT